ncbi:hypothetical protein K9M47_03475 [Candidatus Gracilibacteria bacterium]|nr:hypothetical protein [Candidatus Gracilibacteria bacterium]MCF7898656.1 hypothetical protein [Candidatus Paceibacterota bacterium]
MLSISQKMVEFFQGFGIIGMVNQVINPPQHIRMSVVGSSIDDCLRKLEEKAGIPKYDLSVEGDPREVVTWPVPRKGLDHNIVSKTSEIWRKNNTGYVAGGVFEAVGKSMYSNDERRRMNPMVGFAVNLADSYSFHAQIHISKNCPGVYRDNVCKFCGDVSR